MKVYHRKTILLLCIVFGMIQAVCSCLAKSIDFPDKISRIEDEAFANVKITELNLPEGLRRIGSRAFSNPGLRVVFLPSSLKEIADDAFQGCPALVAVAEPGTYAESWCKKNGIPVFHSISNTIKLGVTYHTQQQIRNFLNAHPSDASSNVSFAVQSYRRAPTVDPYSPGLLSTEVIQNGLNMVNQVRFIAGLNANVVNDSSKEEMVGAAALVIALNGHQSHTPERPVELKDKQYDSLYEDAKEGAAHSNLGGTANMAYNILGCMDDSSPNNISLVGHRRWILNPSMGKTCFGYCYLEKGDSWGHGTGMYIYDRSGSGSQAPVAWPAQQMPLSHLYAQSSGLPWSVSFGHSLDSSAISVSLIRKKDGRVWQFSNDQADGDFYVDNHGCGSPGCVIFRPSGVGTYSANDVFYVAVANASEHTLLYYSVSFF